MALVPCAVCKRHVRIGICPFCASAVGLIGLTLITSCKRTEDAQPEAAPPAVEAHNRPAAVYGAPPNLAQQQLQAEAEKLDALQDAPTSGATIYGGPPIVTGPRAAVQLSPSQLVSGPNAAETDRVIAGMRPGFR